MYFDLPDPPMPKPPQIQPVAAAAPTANAEMPAVEVVEPAVEELNEPQPEETIEVPEPVVEQPTEPEAMEPIKIIEPITAADTGAEPEHPVEVNEPVVLDDLQEILRLTDPNAIDVQSATWLRTAKCQVEDTIDKLLQEFIESPYLCRVEQSMCFELWQMLASPGSILAERCPIGNGPVVSQLVHIEWPETVARPRNSGRRENFAMAVLSPHLLKNCTRIENFTRGCVAPPIVIEIVLDGSAASLANHAKKLLNSKPKRGYLIHLLRDRLLEPEAEQILLHLRSSTGIRTAYAGINGAKKAIKRVNDDAVSDLE